MAKRFIDSELFMDEWFCGLSKDGKLFWVYYITSCNHAGILKINEKLIKFQTGINSLETVTKELGNSIERVSEQYLFCPKFLKFQYPNFPKSKVRQQEGAIRILAEHGLWDATANSLVSVRKELVKTYGNESDSVSGNDKGVIGGKKTLLQQCEEFTYNGYENLKDRVMQVAKIIDENLKKIQQLEEPLTPEEICKLILKGGNLIKVLRNMDNKKTLLKEYSSAYKTALNWLERENNV